MKKVLKVRDGGVYKVQNVAIHKARAELERAGILDPWAGLDQIRDMAAEINLGVRSISSLNIEQRRVLIDRLIEMGARVKNPIIYASDRPAGNVAPFTKISEEQLRMVDTLASQVIWKEKDGFLRFCYKVIKAPRPRNSREEPRSASPSNPSSINNTARFLKRWLIPRPKAVFFQYGNSLLPPRQASVIKSFQLPSPPVFIFPVSSSRSSPHLCPPPRRGGGCRRGFELFERIERFEPTVILRANDAL